MESLSASAAVQHATPEYRNWLSLGHALTTLLCQGLRPFITREVQSFYHLIAATITAPCACLHVPGRKPNPYHDVGTCVWANTLQSRHFSSRPNWKQSDPTKWMDPNLGPWEIAKLFLPDLGGHAHVQSADDMDITAILNLMYWCDLFRVQRPLIKDVREVRNTKWVHVPKLELSESDKIVAFDAIEKLLQDPELVHDRDAQEALREIVKLKFVSDLHHFEAQLLAHLKNVIKNDIKKVKNELKILKKESTRNRKQRSRLEGRLHKMQCTLQDLDKKIKTYRNVAKFAVTVVKFLPNSVVRFVQGMKRGPAVTYIVCLLLCCCFNSLDHRSYNDGCPNEDMIGEVPFDTRELNFSDYLTTARENFVGRQWLYRELEAIFHPGSDISGVLIIGNPGAGKSALCAQLVCSRTSSSLIHGRILGYHLCKYSDKNTQIAGKFVRNLAEMIARRLPEYGYLVSNSSFIQRSLDTDCVNIQDPVGCFEQAILIPLRNLKNKPKDNWFIVVDALDECLIQSETSHSIVYLLNNKLSRFPVWLKLIMTSRNESRVSLYSASSVKNFIIDPEDSRNLDDIELFLQTRLYPDEPLLHPVKMMFGDDSLKSTAKLISALLSKSQGNFLFVKEMLHHWEISRELKNDLYALPKTLGDLYHSYFERKYAIKEKFKQIRRVLELLVATFEPINQTKLFHLLRMKDPTLEEEYDFNDRIRELGHFLRHGQNGTVALYHLSLIEWLTSATNKVFYVSKTKGHEVFCDYYFSLIRREGESALSKYILDLAQHIASGGWKEAYVQEFLEFPSQTVNSTDPQSNRTLLHLAATINSTNMLELMLRHFSDIDCVDNRGITPVFLAAKHGLVDNVALLVKRGARVNRATKSLVSYYKTAILNAFKIDDNIPGLSYPVVEAESSLWDATMIHAAAQGGHLEVVRFLLDNSAFISKVNGVQMTALQLAAENGHVEVVKALYNAGANADQTALYHAAANNRLEVVKYLQSIGVQDNCLRCDGSFYWLRTKLRLQSNRVFILPIKETCKNKETDQKQECIDWDRIKEELDFIVGQPFNDRHLIFCETALHAAVASGYKDVGIGVQDNCLRCDGSFYWLRTKLRLQSNRVFILPNKETCKNKETGQKQECIDWGRIKEELDFIVGQLFNDRHLIFCETALHAAVASGYKDVVSELLSRQKNALVCHDYTGRTPLHIAVRRNDSQLMNLLLGRKKVLIDSECRHWQPIPEIRQDDLYTSGILSFEEFTEYHQDVCHCGYTPLHLAARYGHTDIAIQLLVRGARVDSRDCNGASPLHVAACHNKDSLVHIFTHSRIAGADINNRTLNGSTPLHSAAACGALEVIDHLLYLGANISAVDENGLTPLHYTIINIKSSDLNQKVLLNDSCSSGCLRLVTIDRSGNLADFFREENQVKNTNRYRWLDVFINLALRGSDIDALDRQRRTPLHIAASNGLADAVNVLLQRQAKLEIRDTFGKTPLELAVENATVVFRSLPFSLGKHLDDIRHAVRDHEMVVYLLLSAGASFKKCVRSGSSLLHRAISNYQPYSVQLLLLKGASLACKDNLGRTPLVNYLHNGGNWTDVVLKHFNVSFPIKCGTPFNVSVLHLASYRSPTLENDNFFERRWCDDHKCEVVKGPLMEAVERHPSKYKVFDNCRDAEGLTPLHRAAQGANEVAVRNFLDNGANASILSQQGHDALTLAVLHAGSNLWRLYDGRRIHLEDKKASKVALQLLHHLMKTRGFRVNCDANRTELTVYHLAASRGLVDFIKQLLNERKSHQLDVDCPNKDGVTPLYLAKVFGNKLGNGVYNPWQRVVQMIESHGGRLLYPSRDAELNVLYNRMYGWIPEDLRMSIRSDIKAFVMSILQSYGKIENRSVFCQSDAVDVGDPESFPQIQYEMLKQTILVLLHEKHFSPVVFYPELNVRDICLKTKRRVYEDLVILNKHLEFITRNTPKLGGMMPLTSLEKSIFHKQLFYLMRIWHKELFQHFACIKNYFLNYKLFLAEEVIFTLLIRQYAESVPLLVLNNICAVVQALFFRYLTYNSFKYWPSSFYVNPFEYPDFVKQRMGWALDHNAFNTSSWPFDFLVNFTLGEYRKYNYLKILNVGLDRTTHITLYTDKIRQILQRPRA